MSPLLLDRRGDGDEVVIDPRIQARRSAVTEQRRRRLRRWLLVLAVVVTLGAAVWGLLHSAAADVDQVLVEGGSRTTVEELTAAAAIAPGTPLLEVDPAAVEARLRAQPWVRDARVELDWRAGDVHVSVVERQPVAAVASADATLLVDGDRRVLATVPAAGAGELVRLEDVTPVAVGQQLDPAVQPLLDVAAALTPGLRSRFASVGAGEGGTLELAIRPTGTVRLGGLADLDVKVRSLQTVFSQVDLRCLALVDVRVPDAPVLTREPGCT